MSGKCSPAHSYNAGLHNNTSQFFCAQALQCTWLDGMVRYILPIILNHNRFHTAAVRLLRFFDGLNRSGNAGMNGSTDIALRLADFLPPFHPVTRLYQWIAGCTNMLLQRNPYNIGGFADLNFLSLRAVLAVRRMDSPSKRQYFVPQTEHLSPQTRSLIPLPGYPGCLVKKMTSL